MKQKPLGGRERVKFEWILMILVKSKTIRVLSSTKEREWWWWEGIINVSAFRKRKTRGGAK